MSLIACAEPTGPPIGMTAFAQVESSGRHFSTSSAGPPTKVVASPVQVCAGVRESGASKKRDALRRRAPPPAAR